MGIDYYGVLSLKRTCNDTDIKRAYRRLALEFNPKRLKDKNTEAVFNLIAEAYEVLVDPFTRAVFDQYGEEGLKKGVPGPKDFIQPYTFHGDSLKTYKKFFGTYSPYADLLDVLIHPLPLFNLPEGRGVKTKGPPIKHPLMLTLHEVFHGGIKKMKIQRLVFTDETETSTELNDKILTIPIKPGILPGTEIVFHEEGDRGPKHIPADVIFVTEDRPHEYFVREGTDLVLRRRVTLKEALTGITVTTKTLDNRTLRIPITDIIAPNYEKIVEKEGMPIMGSKEEKGNLIIRFDIEFPGYLPRSSKNLVQRAFNLAKIKGGKGQPELINKIVLNDKMRRIDVQEQPQYL